ncbi:MAG: S41 family peptidase [Flavobacteriales bacterium]
MKSIISLIAFLPFFAISPYFISAQQPASKTTLKFDRVLDYVDRLYVDSVQTDKLVEEAIRAMLEKLDPHSYYVTKEEFEEMNAPLKGNFDGVGVRFQIMQDTIFVVQTIPGGPSEKVGIRAGDKFIEIDNKPVAGVGIKNSGVRDMLLGTKGTKVTVKVFRKGVPDLLTFIVTRDKIPINSLDAAYMVTPTVGYIKLNNFSATSVTEFRAAMKDLKVKGMKDLVIDLQGNGGGYLNTAIELCDELLDSDKLIVYTEGRSYPKEEYKSRFTGSFEKGRLIVLVDESSASASEILSGAVQDWDRGLIVGRRSFGKGLVQKQLTLPDGSAMRLTTQRYYTPAGRCIQKPYNEGKEAYQKEKYSRYESGEAFYIDSIKIPDSLKYQTLIKKRTVFGGGGIIPDVFVPLDTTGTSEYWSRLLRKGIINQFSLNYVDQNREELVAKFPNFQEFKKNFDIETVIKEMIVYGDKEGVEYNEEAYQKSKQAIDLRLKASIAQNIWDFASFYEIINDLNDSLQKAIETLNDGTYDKMKLASNK